MAKVYAVVNRKGGVGKTTTAVSLADGLARALLGEEGEVKGHVLLIDLDPQGNCAMLLGVNVKEGATISELLLGEASADQCIVSADRSDDGLPRPNLFLLPSTNLLAQTKIALVANDAVSEVVSRMTRGSNRAIPVDRLLITRLQNTVDVFDYIIIDCPPSLDVLNNAVYHFADAAIVPVKVDYLGAAGAVQHTQDILEAQAEGINIRVGMIVPTFVKPRQRLAKEILDSLTVKYGQSKVSSPIPASVKLEEAPAVMGGMTIFEYAPDSAPAEAYQELVRRVLNAEV